MLVCRWQCRRLVCSSTTANAWVMTMLHCHGQVHKRCLRPWGVPSSLRAPGSSWSVPWSSKNSCRRNVGRRRKERKKEGGVSLKGSQVGGTGCLAATLQVPASSVMTSCQLCLHEMIGVFQLHDNLMEPPWVCGPCPHLLRPIS